MEQSRLLDAHVQARRIYNLLGEVQDLSRQLAEAVDRDDQTSVRMLMSMRAEPIQQLAKTREALMKQLDSEHSEQTSRLRALLNGEAAQTEAERGLADQVAANARLLKQVQELDRSLSQKITRDKSFYK